MICIGKKYPHFYFDYVIVLLIEGNFGFSYFIEKSQKNE